MHTSKTTTRRTRVAVFALLLSLTAPVIGRTHASNANAFFDDFETVGPLPGEGPTDPWETKTGTWTVAEQLFPDGPLTGDVNHILVQSSMQSANNERVSDPMTLVRDLPFREVTAQVTAAFIPNNGSSEPPASGSLGIVVRSPISDGIADKSNLYLFGAQVGTVGTYPPSGKGLVLFKRVADRYYPVIEPVVSTWADLTKAHEYKVVIGGARVLCYFDGRLVIDYTDKMLGDEPTKADWLPGLPFESGAVGLRTSGTRAWFDNFRAIGNDAYEGRAAAIDGSAQVGEASNARRGTSVELGADSRRLGLGLADTGFAYHDHSDFDDAVVRSVDNPNGGSPSAGASVRTHGAGDGVVSTARLTGLDVAVTDPNSRIRVLVNAQAVDATSTASCSGTSSSVNLANGSITILVTSVDPRGGNTVIGPIPLNASYEPNTVLFRQAPLPLTIYAHAVTKTNEPHRVDLSAIKIVFAPRPMPATPVAGVATTPEVPVPGLPVEASIGAVVAGRYCR